MKRQHWVLAAILAVAAAIRLWHLGSLPPGIFRDEAEKALNGWFILHSGADQWGRPWPLFIKVFGVTTSALYHYATIPFLAIGGLNEWTARMPAALAGVATVLFTWLWCRRVWGWQVAAWAGALLAISPWSVPLSRWAQQGVFLPMFFAAAAWGLAVFLSADKSRPRANPRAAIALCTAAAATALAIYAYDPARLFAPLLAVAAAVIWWRTWIRHWPAVLAAIVTFALFAAPTAWLLATQGSATQARFRFLSVFQPGTSIATSLAAFASNYLAHFSPAFLLLRGDEELRHSGGVGMLNFMEFAGAIVGAIYAIRRSCKWGIFCITWILLAPVAASLTRVGVPHALRSQVALPAWQVLAASGIVGLLQCAPALRRKSLTQLAALLVLLGSLPFFLSYFGSYRGRSAFSWQYGVKQSLQYLDSPAARDSTVYLHNIVGAEYLIGFYQGMDRNQFQRLISNRTRYKLMPFQPPDRSLPTNQPGPTAWVTIPGYQWSSDFSAIPITVPNQEEFGPAALVILNPELMQTIVGTTPY